MKQIIIISLVVALVFFTLGYVIGSKKNNSSSQLYKEVDTFQAGWDAAKKRLADLGITVSLANLAIKNVSGQVNSIKGNDITIKIRPLEPLADPNLDERIIKIDANTKIYILEQKDLAQYQSEMAEFRKKTKQQYEAGGASAVGSQSKPPEFSIKKPASLADIKVGATISVVAMEEDIKNAKQFIAAEIMIPLAPAAKIEN